MYEGGISVRTLGLGSETLPQGRLACCRPQFWDIVSPTELQVTAISCNISPITLWKAGDMHRWGVGKTCQLRVIMTVLVPYMLYRHYKHWWSLACTDSQGIRLLLLVMAQLLYVLWKVPSPNLHKFLTEAPALSLYCISSFLHVQIIVYIDTGSLRVTWISISDQNVPTYV
jgi:hypothetical protein